MQLDQQWCARALTSYLLQAISLGGLLLASPRLRAAEDQTPQGTAVSTVKELPAAPEQARFRFETINDKSLGLWEGSRPVLVYNHGILLKPGVPENRRRSSYIHPLYGLDGEVLSDDFPRDHYHHRGIFWAWPHIRIAGKEYDLWGLRGIAHRFECWTQREASAQSAVLGIGNGWYIGEQRVVAESVLMTVRAASSGSQAIDFDLVWTALREPVTLWGAPGKSYGGFNLRFAPRKETVITVPEGRTKRDLLIARLPWADLSARFAGAPQVSGAAIFISPKHPDYPPTWLTRHYGVLCVGWPGIKPSTLQPGKPVRCRYRVWIHRGAADAERLEHAYDEYMHAEKGEIDNVDAGHRIRP